MARGSSLSFNSVKTFLMQTYQEWDAVEAPRLGASLAYFTVLSMAPLVLIAVSLAGLIFGQKAAEGAITGQIQGLIGGDAADTIRQILQQASAKKTAGTIASIIGFVVLLISASSVALELRSSLDKIWRVKEQEGVSGFLKERSYAIAIVFAAGFLLLVSLMITAALASIGKFFGGLLPIPAWLLQIANSLISLIVITFVFAAIFKWVPAVSLTWRDVIAGAVFTAVLFTIGKFVIGLYLGKASVGSSYGAAGSLIVILVWVYYSAQILFFGAAFTRTYTRAHGSQSGSKEPARAA